MKKSPNVISGHRFSLKDTNLFLCPGNEHMIHLASIAYGFREFLCMLDRRTSKVYVEEVVLEGSDNKGNIFANLKFIEDDNLAFDLAKFLDENKVIDMKRVNNYLLDQKKNWLVIP